MNLKYSILFFAALIFYSCENGLFNAGDTINKEILLIENFDVMEIQNTFEITLIQDTVNKAIITSGENLMSDIDIHISDNTLWLNHSISNNWSRDYQKVKLKLHLKTVPRIYVRKPALIETQDTFKTTNFVVVVWQSRFAEVNACIDADFCGIYMTLDDFSRIVVKGKTKNSDIQPCGSGFVDCSMLNSEICNIKQRSISQSLIHVSKQLTVEFGGKGNIYYSGNPDSIIYVNQPVSGKLIKVDN